VGWPPFIRGFENSITDFGKRFPSFTAINTRISALANKLDTLRSKLVFLNKNAS
jgi:hypothetical protein